VSIRSNKPAQIQEDRPLSLSNGIQGKKAYVPCKAIFRAI
jgi:hypothetical protein